MDDIFRGFANSSWPVSCGLPVLLLTIGLARKNSLLRYNSLYLGSSVLSAAILSVTIKYRVAWPRPYVVYPFLEKLISGGGPSFPSGQTSDAFSIATSLSIAYPKWYIIIPSCLWAGFVAYSRMDLGVHYHSDVLVGAFVGAGSAYLFHKCWRLIRNSKRTIPKNNTL